MSTAFPWPPPPFNCSGGVLAILEGPMPPGLRKVFDTQKLTVGKPDATHHAGPLGSTRYADVWYGIYDNRVYVAADVFQPTLSYNASATWKRVQPIQSLYKLRPNTYRFSLTPKPMPFEDFFDQYFSGYGKPGTLHVAQRHDTGWSNANGWNGPKGLVLSSPFPEDWPADDLRSPQRRWRIEATLHNTYGWTSVLDPSDRVYELVALPAYSQQPPATQVVMTCVGFPNGYCPRYAQIDKPPPPPYGFGIPDVQFYWTLDGHLDFWNTETRSWFRCTAAPAPAPAPTRATAATTSSVASHRLKAII